MVFCSLSNSVIARIPPVDSGGTFACVVALFFSTCLGGSFTLASTSSYQCLTGSYVFQMSQELAVLLYKARQSESGQGCLGGHLRIPSPVHPLATFLGPVYKTPLTQTIDRIISGSSPDCY